MCCYHLTVNKDVYIIQYRYHGIMTMKAKDAMKTMTTDDEKQQTGDLMEHVKY